MKLRDLHSVVVATAFIGFAMSARADQVSLNPIKDNTIYEEGDLSNGMGSYLFAGATSGGTVRRALLAFDIAGAVPEGSTIRAASLTLNLSRTKSAEQDVSLHRLLQDWAEGSTDAVGEEGGGGKAENGDATWTHAIFPDTAWTSPGGQFDGDSSSTISVGEIGTYTWESTEALVSNVQSWLDDPLTNFGWILIGNEPVAESAKRFDSRQFADRSNWPVLTIDFDTSEGLRGDFNGDGILDAMDIDSLTAEVRMGTHDAAFDLNTDKLVTQEDRRIWVAEIKRTFFGDSDLDGEFNTGDLVLVFQAGEYEDAVEGNSTWGTGDWNADGDFTTSDLVTAFQDGGYEMGPRATVRAVPEPSSILILAMTFVISIIATRQRGSINL